MPFNLLKKYNQLLEIRGLAERVRTDSLLGVFNRDITNNSKFKFRDKKINPTPAKGQDSMERLFNHLTRVVTDKTTNHREFDVCRAERLHWVRFHIDESKKDEMLIFSVDEPQGNRTYIYDTIENYVIVLEPLRNVDEYYLLTAYFLQGKDKARNKMLNKYKKRRLDKVL